MPYLGSTLFFVALALALVVSLTAWMLLARALAPGIVASSGERWSRPGRHVLLGAVIFAAWLVMVLGAFAVPFPLAKLTGLLLLTGLVAFALTGLAGLAGMLGTRLVPEGSVLRQHTVGAVVLELAFLLPLVGWFVVLPLALAGGTGVVAASLLERMRAPVRSDAPA